MVSSIIATSLSGLNAASVRLSNSANNVANVQSTSRVENGQRVDEAFQPQRVEQTSLATGGVRTELRAVSPATTPVFLPESLAADENGVVEFPNVNLEEEVIQQQIATYDFQANLKVLKAADEMAKDLLDITA